MRLFIRFGQPYFGLFLLAVVCLCVAGALALAFPYYVGKLLDAALTRRDLTELNQSLLFLVGVLTVQSIFSFGRTFLLNYIGERLVADMREALYQHLIRLSAGFFSNQRVGELTSRVSSDVTVIQAGTTSNLAEAMRQVIVLIGGLTAMFITNPRLTTILLGVIPVLAGAAAFFGRGIRKISSRVQDRLAEAAAQLDESLANIRTVQSFVRERYEGERYRTHIQASLRQAIKRAFARGGFNAFIVFILFNGIVVLLWYTSRQVLEGTLTIGQVTSFFLYTSVVGTALGAFAELVGEFNQTIGASRRVIELFGTMPDIADDPKAEPVGEVIGRVEFRNVGFSYPGREDVRVLDAVNISANPGEVIALVGPSGAGKSTIISLLPRFYDVKDGAILVDGRDVRTWRLDDLRGNIGIVPQETAIFSGTIADNIAYGKLDATEADIRAVAAAANALEFIEAFPDGFKTVVGERGIKLSGGQRQRIAIARALLKNPRILILDEATSSLDSESEGLVQAALETLMRGRTTLVIAHRLSTVRRANRILVVTGGRIIEEGTHQELIDRDGTYRRLYDMQFQEV